MSQRQSQKKTITSAFVAIVLLLYSSYIYAAIPSPPDRPSNYVTDLAGLFKAPELSRLNGILKDLDEKTGAQIFVLTINSLEGVAIESFSISMAEKWKPGQKGKDNGVLITVSVKDRAYRIEVGYGLEGLLPDSLVGSLGRELLVPEFRQGRYTEGLFALCNELVGIIAQDYGVTISGITLREKAVPKGSKEMGLTDMLLMILVGIVILYILFRHPELFLLVLTNYSGGRGSWSGGGGFGGGGGGSFGGGGASGRW